MIIVFLEKSNWRLVVEMKPRDSLIHRKNADENYCPHGFKSHTENPCTPSLFQKLTPLGSCGFRRKKVLIVIEVYLES